MAAVCELVDVTQRGRYIPQQFVDSILQLTNEYFFKTPTQGKTGDLIWRYDNKKGIWLPDGNTWVEKQVAATLGKKVKQRNLSETVKLFQVATYCKPEDFQEDVGSICLQNGELELGSYVTKEFNPEHNHKNQLPVKYNPEVDCPNFKKFLTEVAPGDENSFQELFGYFLVQSYPIQKCFILQGSGANGKSTLLRVMEAFLGKENCSSVGLYDLVTKTFSKAELHGKLANIAPDIGSDELRKTGIFKALTGGDTITAERKNQHPFQFKNYAKMIFSCNQLPTSPDNSEAFFRRFMIFQFKQVFDEKDPKTKPQNQLLAELTTEQELSGILNWALVGYDRLMKNNQFVEGKSTKDTKQLYLEMSDPINAFINEVVEEDSIAITPKNDILKAYGDFCLNHGFVSMAENKFFSELKKRVFVHDTQKTIDKIRVRALIGLKLTPAQVAQDAQVVHTQEIKIKNIVEYIVPVQPVQPVQEDRSLIQLLRETLNIFSIDQEEAIEVNTLFGLMEKDLKLNVLESQKIVNILVRDGTIFEPRPGFYKRA